MNNIFKKLIFPLSLGLLLLVSLSNVNAQNQANVWWFGTHAGIDFNTSPPTALNGLPINTYEGCSSISDPITGALIFATDGQSVWYPGGTTIVNGTGLFGASSSASSALVVPNPSNPNQWFIFTSNVDPSNGTSHGHNYYVVDRTAGPTLTVTGGVHPLLGPTVSTEQLVGLGDGASGYWLVTHGVGNNTFYAFHVSSAGVVTSAPVMSSVGTAIGATNYISSMKANTCQNKLGLTNLNAGIAEVYNFDNSTGTVTSLLYSVTGLTNPYGVEFSPKDKYMYYGTLGGQMYQMDMSSGVSSLTGWTAPPNGTGKFGQLQLAPDGKIYVASEDVNSTTYVGTISAPDNAFATAGYNAMGFTLSTINTTISQLGLPTFSRTFISSVATVLPGDGTYCTNTAIPLSFTFSGLVKPTTISWTATGGGQTFTPGGASSTNASPSVTFSTTGAKIVTLKFDDTCGNHYTKPMNFTIVSPKTPAGTVSCSGNNLVLDNPASDPDEPNYIWYRNSVSPANIIGTGTPFNYTVGTGAVLPGQICIGESSTTPVVTSVSNHTIAASNTLSSIHANSPYTSPQINVLATTLFLKSFKIGFRYAATIDLTVTIKLGATVVYNQTTTALAVPAGTGFTVPVNTTLTKGNNYTIVISTNPSGLEMQSDEWLGATNAGEIFYSNSTPVNGFTGAVADLIYDASNITVTPTCSAPTCISVACTLPIHLLYFTGKNADTKNILNWATVSETNNDFFEIQRSTDGINFFTIGTMKGSGNSSTIHEYQFADASPANGVNYYKLVQHDYNGDISTSSVVKITSSLNGSATFTVSPNPSNESFNISFQNISGGEFDILNVLGQTLSHKTVTSGTENISVGTELPKGAYILRFSGTSGVYTQLVIKE